LQTSLELQALLFDFDGVLLDSEPVHFICWQEALGLTLDWERYSRECIGISERATVERIAAWQDPPADFALLWRGYPEKKRLFREKMDAAPPFPPGMPAFIAEMAARFPLGVVTSSARVEVEPLLERVGIRPYLGALVCGGDVEHLKPAPDPYLLAARQLGVTNPLVIEDSEPGMTSARRAGFPALRVPSARETIPAVRAYLAQRQDGRSR